jgi:phosphoribosylglycinamide formyltransferase 1
MSSCADRPPRQAIVVLISGTGSNLQALVEAAARQQWSQTLGAEVVAVISSRADAPGLAFAREAGLAAEVLDHRSFESRQAYDQALMQCIDRHRPALVVLAGFMRILTPGFVATLCRADWSTSIPRCYRLSPGSTRTNVRSMQVARWLVPQCTRSRPSSTTGRFWRRWWCRCCPATVRASAGCARAVEQEHLLYPQAVRDFAAALAAPSAPQRGVMLTYILALKHQPGVLAQRVKLDLGPVAARRRAAWRCDRPAGWARPPRRSATRCCIAVDEALQLLARPSSSSQVTQRAQRCSGWR